MIRPGAKFRNTRVGAVCAVTLSCALLAVASPQQDVAATSSGEAVHLTRSTRKNDLVIAISFRRGLRLTVEGLRQARANGAYCVGIADTLVSPIARFSHDCFVASVETPAFGASYAAPVTLLNGILAACGHYDRKGSMVVLKKAAEEQRSGFRWYPG